MKTINFLIKAALVYSLVSCSGESVPEYSVYDIPSPAAHAATSPRLSAGPGDELILSWLQPVNDHVALRYARFSNGAWGKATTVTEADNLFVNWADLPSVVPLGSGHLAAHWLQASGNRSHAYDIALAESYDGGRSWSAARSPHDDGTDTEHGFVSIYPDGGVAGLLWLDGRKMVNEVTDDPVASGMTLRSDTQLVDELVCECCQTDVAIAASGPIAVYRDRSVDEIRDIYVARSIDGQWQAGMPVASDNWRIDGCPVNGPSIAANGKQVAVAWFTAVVEPRVQLAVSADSGASFSAPIEVVRGATLGRVAVELLQDDAVAVSWLAPAAHGLYAVQARRLSADAPPGPVRLIAFARALSVPQMSRQGAQLIFAWTESADDSSRIATGAVDIAAL